MLISILFRGMNFSLREKIRMSRRKITMSVQQDVLQYKKLGKKQRHVARLLGVNSETVARYWNEHADEALSSLEWVSVLNWDYIRDQLNSGVSRKILYEELAHDKKLPAYSNFCRQLVIQLSLSPPDPKVTMKIFRQPGHSVEVDHSGNSLEIINPATGEIISCELFVGALTFSSYFYAEFTYTQRLEDFINSHIRCFEFFGGVPEFAVPDNCLTAVTKAGKHDVVLNSSYADMCRHYGLIVDPARVRRSQDKPMVERSIGILQTDFFPRVRNRTFTSLHELNQVLRAYLLERMKVVMKERGRSREEFFAEEKVKLRPLPDCRYEIHHFRTAKVHPNCHIQHQRNFYSVPYQFFGKEVQVKFNQKLVHIYHHTELLHTHVTLRGEGHYSTVDAHYPEKKLVDTNYHLGVCRLKAQQIGENMQILTKKLIDEPRHPLKNLGKLQGILALAEIFGAEALEEAVGSALELNKMTYAFIKQCAKNYRPSDRTLEVKAPLRQLELICLQGGRL
jgi:hypothetical protein